MYFLLTFDMIVLSRSSSLSYQSRMISRLRWSLMRLRMLLNSLSALIELTVSSSIFSSDSNVSARVFSFSSVVVDVSKDMVSFLIARACLICLSVVFLLWSASHFAISSSVTSSSFNFPNSTFLRSSFSANCMSLYMAFICVGILMSLVFESRYARSA